MKEKEHCCKAPRSAKYVPAGSNSSELGGRACRSMFQRLFGIQFFCEFDDNKWFRPKCVGKLYFLAWYCAVPLGTSCAVCCAAQAGFPIVVWRVTE